MTLHRSPKMGKGRQASVLPQGPVIEYIIQNGLSCCELLTGSLETGEMNASVLKDGSGQAITALPHSLPPTPKKQLLPVDILEYILKYSSFPHHCLKN